MFNQQNVIVVLGDLGAGANFVKNMLLLSPDVDFPHSPRLEFIKAAAYPNSLKNDSTHWITHEYKLRKWQFWYGVDIADNYSDINTPQVQQVTQTRKIVFLCHDPAIVRQIKKQYPKIVVVSLHAATENGVAWQLSQFISKLGIDRMHNFSFESNVDSQKQAYIQQHGLEQYQKFNALNAFEIMRDRKDNFNHADYITIRIEDLQTDTWIPNLIGKLGISIDLSDAFDLAKTWRKLNPPFKQYWEILHNETN